jgi:hypothetical protein
LSLWCGAPFWGARTPSSRNHSLGFIKPNDWKPPTTSQTVPDAIVPGADIREPDLLRPSATRTTNGSLEPKLPCAVTPDADPAGRHHMEIVQRRATSSRGRRTSSRTGARGA